MADELGNLTVEEFTSPALGETPPVETPESGAEGESEESSEEGEEIPNTDEDELDEVSLKEARHLYKLLKGPNSAEVVRILAKNAGILDTPIETKADAKAATKDLKTVFKEKLGEFAFLSDKIGPAIEEYINDRLTESDKKFQSLEIKNTEREILSITAKLNRETKGEFDKFESEMAKLAEDILPGPNMSNEKYMRHLFTIASAKGKVDPKNLVGKIERNRTNVADRVQGSPAGKAPAFDPSKRYSLKESVAMAAAQLSGGKGKGTK